MKLIFAALALLAAGCGNGTAMAPSDQGGVTLTGRVVDRADIIDEATERELDQRSADLEKRTSDQLVVVTLPSLDGKAIEEVSLNLANRWGIGREDIDNGVMILVAPTERKVRIEVGTGLEGLLTDARAKEIAHRMLPSFKGNLMPHGIKIGVTEIDQILSSDLRRPKRKPAAMRKVA